MPKQTGAPVAGEQVERDQGVTAEAGITVGHDKPDAAARVARKPDHGGDSQGPPVGHHG
jgi:hypothetical protein